MGLDFLIPSLVVILSPGAGVVLTLAAGMTHGPRAAVLTAFGCTLGIVPHMLAAITGLAAALQAGSTAFTALQVIGVGYLLVMAVQSLREDGLLSLDSTSPQNASPRRSPVGVVRHAIVINLINPKLSLFFLAFLPQFIHPDDPDPRRLMILQSLAFMGLSFGVFTAYGLLAARVRHRILSRPAVVLWMRRGFAATFLILGIKVAFLQG